MEETSNHLEILRRVRRLKWVRPVMFERGRRKGGYLGVVLGAKILAPGVELIAENGGGAGVRLRKSKRKSK